MSEIKRTTTGDPDFCNLIQLLDKDLWERYPHTQQNFTRHNIMNRNEKTVVIYHEGVPVGCGCFRETVTSGTIEIKRMFVLEQARGKGFATMMMKELEEWAVETGYREAILETGAGQPEAIALYQKLGYQRIENYGPYRQSAESVCMGKQLGV